MESITSLARENRVDLKVLNAAREVNVQLADRLLQKVAAALQTVQNKDVGILGLSFKPNTNSVAGSASLQLAQNLLAGGARVRAYDPVAIPDARMQLNGAVKYCESAYGVAEGADALIVATGWPEFRALDFTKIRHLVKRPIIIDTKNLLDSSRLRAMGFQYMGVGR
jgi:UDPglucose 6-dehydrogenase